MTKLIDNYQPERPIRSVCSDCIHKNNEDKCKTCHLYAHKCLSKKLGVIQ